MSKLNVMRSDLIATITRRIEALDHKHGGPTFDGAHSMIAWRAILSAPMARLDKAIATEDARAFYRALVDIAAVALTAWVRFDADPDSQKGKRERIEDDGHSL